MIVMKRPLTLSVPLLCLLAACSSENLPSVDSHDISGQWGVVDDSPAFGNPDSTFYLINPVAMSYDSTYYNSLYTDTYFRTDSARVSLRYAVDGEIDFCFRRHYAVEVNPATLLLSAKDADSDSLLLSETRLTRAGENGDMFRADSPKRILPLLESGRVLKMQATTLPSAPDGIQTYSFIIETAGFKKARQLCDSLVTQRADSLSSGKSKAHRH